MPYGDNGVGHGGDRLTRDEQEHYLLAITRTFLSATLSGSNAAREALAGNAAITGLEDVVVAPSFQDSFQLLRASALDSQIAVYPFTQSPGAYNASFFHETSGYVVAWQSTPTSLGFALAGEEGAATPRFVTFRVAQVAAAENPTNRFARLDIDLTDSAGRKRTGRSDWAGATIAPYYERPPEPDPYKECQLTSYQKTVLGSVRMPLSCFQGDAAFDAANVRTIEVRPRDAQGVLALTDFQLVP
jgi:hypothetical protein